MTDATFQEINELGKLLRDLSAEESVLRNQLKEITEKIDTAKAKVLEFFEKLGDPSYKTHQTPYCKLTRRTSYRYKFPKELENKQKLKEFMGAERYFEMSQIVWNTFNTYCAEVVEKAREDGDIDALEIPGVGAPQTEVTVAVQALN